MISKGLGFYQEIALLSGVEVRSPLASFNERKLWDPTCHRTAQQSAGKTSISSSSEASAVSDSLQGHYAWVDRF